MGNEKSWQERVKETSGKIFLPFYGTDPEGYPVIFRIVEDEPHLITPTKPNAKGKVPDPFLAIDVEVHSIGGVKSLSPLKYTFSLNGKKSDKLANLQNALGVESLKNQWIECRQGTYDHPEYGEVIGYEFYQASPIMREPKFANEIDDGA